MRWIVVECEPVISSIESLQPAAIEMISVLLSNRALCKIKRHDWHGTDMDASGAIELRPDSAKAYGPASSNLR